MRAHGQRDANRPGAPAAAQPRVAPQPAGLSSAALLALQRTAGNQRVQRILQRASQDTNAGASGALNTYDTEDFQHKGATRERVKTVVGYPYLTGVEKPPPPNVISFLAAGADVLAGDDVNDFLGWHRGHVLAHTLGGKNVKHNLVPMKPSFNTSKWKLVEGTMLVKTVMRPSGHYRVTITMGYAGADGRIPSSFTVVHERYDAADGGWKPDAPPEVVTHDVP
jgi:hypothetical protein